MGVGSVLEIVMGALFTAAMGIFVFRVAKATDEEKRHCRFTAAAFAVGSAFGVAAEWLMNIGMENLEAHERTITDELLKMGDIDGIRILGPRSNKERIGTVAFEVEGVHPHDVGQGIAIRVGHHCAQPVHRHFGVYASNRASSGIYNSVEDAQALIEALGKVRPFFGVE